MVNYKRCPTCGNQCLKHMPKCYKCRFTEKKFKEEIKKWESIRETFTK